LFKKGARVLVEVVDAHLKAKADTQLSVAKRNIVDNFLKTGDVTIYIDDIDRGWSASR
jgi:hypothetical protein